MQWVITKQVIVEAETPEEAVANSKDAPTAVIQSVQPRPRPAQQGLSSGMIQGSQFSHSTTQPTPQIAK